jgi:hypothetical protein
VREERVHVDPGLPRQAAVIFHRFHILTGFKQKNRETALLLSKVRIIYFFQYWSELHSMMLAGILKKRKDAMNHADEPLFNKQPKW